jgi:adenylate cyclase|tara:strand:- start:249 stop:2018 length:1770 start_codon:yes stop_codon:yes gene_type:complete
MTKYLIPLALLVLLGLPLIYESTPTEILKLKTFDALIPEQQPSGYFTVLNITEDDITREGGYPLPRQRLAEINTQLKEKGALGIGWVVAFPQPDRFGGDEAFKQSLEDIPSVLAMFEGDNALYPNTTGTVILGEDVGGTPAAGVIQNIDLFKQSSQQGIAVARTEVDSLIRRLPLLLRTPDGWVPAYGTEVLKILVGADTYVIKTNDNGLEEIRVRGLPPVPVDSLGRKWISFVNTPHTNLKDMDVQDKFVFIGYTAKGIMPQLATPVGLLEPHMIQASLAESILIENSPYVPDYAIALELMLFALSICIVWVLLNVGGMSLGIVLGLTIMIATTSYGYWTIQQGLLIDVTWSLISQFITGATAFYLRFREQYKLRLQIKQQFGKYLDPRMVKKLQDNPELCQVNGKRVDCSIIFTDLRGFTSLSESVEPEMVTHIMNSVLDVQVQAVNKYFGCTDKFIGDAGMFHWNTIIPQENHHDLALDAAKEIEKNIAALNVEFKQQGIPAARIGIGVNSGTCIAGNFGATDRFAFSLIGDPCNVAARLESGTKEAGVDVLIGEETAQNSKHMLKFLQELSVKGKEKPLNVYTWQ